MGKRPFRRLKRAKLPNRTIIVYDLETTRIAAGTPEPLYLALCGPDGTYGEKTVGLDALGNAVRRHMLTDDNIGARFVGYNANRFDAYLIAQSLANDPNLYVEPYMTRSGQLRGLMIMDAENSKRKWFFSDAMAMFGFQGSLRDFLRAFAPEQEKLKIDIENFDPDNPEHVDYAIRDVQAPYIAVTNAAHALREVTGLHVQNTIGKVAVKYLQLNLPENVNVWQPPYSAMNAVRATKRGGYVYCKKPYRGNVWKYDINQSYAHQMRKPLPSGRCMQTGDEIVGLLGIYEVTIERDRPAKVPFYIRPSGGLVPQHVDGTEPVRGWITSPEIQYLRKRKWRVTVHWGWVWSDSFNLSEMVNHLENARQNCDGGPKGPQGLMIKAVGNNAFGKTIEEHDGQRFRICGTCPGENWFAHRSEDPTYNGVWVSFDNEAKVEDYHRPQIGSFILAYGRIQLMECAHIAEDNFIYADTDCVMFSSDVTAGMDLDETRYGAWKIEARGSPYIVIAKKVYCLDETDQTGNLIEAHAKGLHVQKLSRDDFIAWYYGDIPIQEQTQRQGFLKVLTGGAMFRERSRRGSRQAGAD